MRVSISDRPEQPTPRWIAVLDVAVCFAGGVVVLIHVASGVL
jgi:hypothetical protein